MIYNPSHSDNTPKNKADCHEHNQSASTDQLHTSDIITAEIMRESGT